MSGPQLNNIIDNLSLTYHLENSELGIILWNSQFELIYTSPKAQSIFEWQPGSGLHQPFRLNGFVFEEEEAKVKELVDDLVTGKADHNQCLNRNYTVSGKLIYCQWYNSALKDSDGKVIHILSLVQDITHQMHTSLSLQASERQLSLVFDGAIDPMWIIIVEGNSKFRFERINAAFTTVTGWTKEQVEGQPIEVIMPQTSHELVRGKYNEAINFGKIIDYVEEAAHPSGIKYGEIRVIPIRNEKGEVTRLLGIANDITEKIYLQKKLQAERDNLNRQITSAAIKGQELARASVSKELHDNVNQVLTTVKLYIELCVDQKAPAAEVLPKSASLLNETINEIRNLSKQLSAPSLGEMNFKDTLKDLVDSVSTAAQIKTELQIDLQQCSDMDAELHLAIYRIIQEQLTNILKHAKASKVFISLNEKDGTLQLLVQDNGIGFNTTHKTHGIGLTNMQSRTEILGGQFSIQSGENGTRLQVHFPVVFIEGKCLPVQSLSTVTP